jgi:two-component system, NarL family, nitrate/nitrite response regulator NarL
MAHVFQRDMMPTHSQPVASLPVRLLIAEHHPIVLLGLERFLSSIEDFAVVATATEGTESLAAARAHTPDVAVLDIGLAGKSGLEVGGEIIREGLPTRVVLITPTIDDREAVEAFRLGIHGVLLKEMAPGLLVQCIRKVVAGGRWVELESLRRAVENLLRNEALPGPAASPLTRAEVRVAGLLAQGARNKEIAGHLGVSESTIKNHLHNIYTKLNLSSRGELARWYRTGGHPSGSSTNRSTGRFEQIPQPSAAT